jgi:ribosome-binding protein aMBF1 (putative translation factor)
MKKSIKDRLKAALSLAPEEQFEHDAQLLVSQFLSSIDSAMADKEISKKELAEKIGTSPSFITQLFMGDRKPNWVMLAKMQKELGLSFKVLEEQDLKSLITDELMDYHRKWIKTRQYEVKKGDKPSESIMSIDYALAG